MKTKQLIVSPKKDCSKRICVPFNKFSLIYVINCNHNMIIFEHGFWNILLLLLL